MSVSKLYNPTNKNISFKDIIKNQDNSTNIGDPSVGQALKLSLLTRSHLPAGLLLYLTALCYTPSLRPPSQKKLLALCEDPGFLLATAFEEAVW